MSSTAGVGAEAFYADVAAGKLPSTRAYLDALADDAERAVTLIEAKIEGMKTSLATAKAEAKRTRADADQARKRGQ